MWIAEYGTSLRGRRRPAMTLTGVVLLTYNQMVCSGKGRIIRPVSITSSCAPRVRQLLCVAKILDEWSRRKIFVMRSRHVVVNCSLTVTTVVTKRIMIGSKERGLQFCRWNATINDYNRKKREERADENGLPSRKNRAELSAVGTGSATRGVSQHTAERWGHFVPVVATEHQLNAVPENHAVIAVQQRLEFADAFDVDNA